VDRREIEGVGRLAYFRDPDGNMLGVIEPQRAG
jgi:predicted enzyme related to lactoylglutathione lyase